MKIEMADNGISFSKECVTTVYCKHFEIGRQWGDFLVEENSFMEIKAVINLEKVNLAQAINYLEACELTADLLINLGVKSLIFKLLNNKKLN